MHEWFRISILLCSFGFLKEVRPSEPFLTNYLLGDQYFNMTEEDVSLSKDDTLGRVIIIFIIYHPYRSFKRSTPSERTPGRRSWYLHFC